MLKLHDNLALHLSTVADGSMKNTKAPQLTEPAVERFLQKHDILPEETVFLRVTYDGDDYCRYSTVTQSNCGDGVVRTQSLVADSLVTTDANTALFLPIGDCVGAVLYHPSTNVLMLAHLGRQSLEQGGATRSVEYLMQECTKLRDASEVLVYLSPAASGKQYPLYHFDGRSLHDVALAQLRAAGVSLGNITLDKRCTVTSSEFYSHSAYLRGNKPHGRHALVAMIKK